VNRVGNDRDQVLQECGCGVPVRLPMELSERKSRRAVDGNEQMEFALCGMNCGNVDVEVANGIAPCLAGAPTRAAAEVAIDVFTEKLGAKLY